MVRCPQGFSESRNNSSHSVALRGFNSQENGYIWSVVDSNIQCTIGCRNPSISPIEWERNLSNTMHIASVGASLMIFLLVGLILGKKSRMNILTLSLSVATILTSLAFMLPIFHPSKDIFCKNYLDGFSDRDSTSMCVVQGSMLMYSALATGYAVTTQSLELYFQIILSRPFLSHVHHIIAIFTTPLLSVLVNSFFGSFGFANFYPWCFTINSSLQWRLNLLTYYGPGAICVCIIFFCTIAIVVSIVRTIVSKRNKHTLQDGRSDQLPPNTSIFISYFGFGDEIRQYIKSLSVTRTIIVLLVVVLMLTLTTFAQVVIDIVRKSAYQASFSSWANCIFSNFDGRDDASWISACGLHPRVRSQQINMFLLPSTSICVAIIFCPFEYFYNTLSGFVSNLVSRLSFCRFADEEAQKQPRNCSSTVETSHSTPDIPEDNIDRLPEIAPSECDPAVNSVRLLYSDSVSNIPSKVLAQPRVFSFPGSDDYHSMHNVYSIVEESSATLSDTNVVLDIREDVPAMDEAGRQFLPFAWSTSSRARAVTSHVSVAEWKHLHSRVPWNDENDDNAAHKLDGRSCVPWGEHR